MKPIVDTSRIENANAKEIGNGPIVYWMSRDQRVRDNWALLYAQELAVAQKVPMAVVFCLSPEFLGATTRQYEFMLKGLQEVEASLAKYRIPLFVRIGEPDKEIAKFADTHHVGAVVSDFDPLRIKRAWHTRAGKALSCALFEVDAHNVVPCRAASPKREFGAYTLRPKIRKVLSHFLTDFPKVKTQSISWKRTHAPVNWGKVRDALSLDTSVPELTDVTPGEKAARKILQSFIKSRLATYDEARNDPNKDAQSNLSPYLHFGQISAQRVALEVRQSDAPHTSRDAFLEELIVRKELSDNFCYYAQNYDSFDAFPEWAKESLNAHRNDTREYTYTRAQLEKCATHDELWNAAQHEMVTTGKMHGYMRMYWAKKILEWSKTPEDALATAIYLNDKYELDGRDPNGYSGIAWSIGGVHDRAWFSRPIFGKIRYMSYGGARSKFDTNAYIKKYGNT